MKERKVYIRATDEDGYLLDQILMAWPNKLVGFSVTPVESADDADIILGRQEE